MDTEGTEAEEDTESSGSGAGAPACLLVVATFARTSPPCWDLQRFAGIPAEVFCHRPKRQLAIVPSGVAVDEQGQHRRRRMGELPRFPSQIPPLSTYWRWNPHRAPAPV